MSDELATLDLNQLPSTQLGNDEAFAELSKGGDFLKYVKLYTKGEMSIPARFPLVDGASRSRAEK